MANYGLSGAHYLRKWLWYKVGNMTYAGGNVFNSEELRGRIPIIPTQQIPEFTNQTGPFIVYNYSIVSHPDRWFVDEERMSLIIYDNREDRLRNLFNYIHNLLSRPDNAPGEINKYLFETNPLSPIEFKTINTLAGTSAEPYTSEGGRQSVMVVCGYTFAMDSDSSGMRL